MTGIGGNGYASRRLRSEDRLKYDRMLSERHMDYWGTECPAVDLDFLMCEFNHGVPVAIVDYKYGEAPLENTNALTFQALSSFHKPDGGQLPFFIARYWPHTWAIRLLAVNNAAIDAVRRISSGQYAPDEEIPLSERQYVSFLYRLRKDALSAGDVRYLDRLNGEQPPGAQVLVAA